MCAGHHNNASDLSFSSLQRNWKGQLRSLSFLAFCWMPIYCNSGYQKTSSSTSWICSRTGRQSRQKSRRGDCYLWLASSRLQRRWCQQDTILETTDRSQHKSQETEPLHLLVSKCKSRHSMVAPWLERSEFHATLKLGICSRYGLNNRCFRLWCILERSMDCWFLANTTLQSFLFAIVAAATWAHHWSGKRIRFHCDNQAVVKVWPPKNHDLAFILAAPLLMDRCSVSPWKMSKSWMTPWK